MKTNLQAQILAQNESRAPFGAPIQIGNQTY